MTILSNILIGTFYSAKENSRSDGVHFNIIRRFLMIRLLTARNQHGTREKNPDNSY